MCVGEKVVPNPDPGIDHHVRKDDRVRTEIVTPAGVLPFQEYFVKRAQRDEVLDVRFAGIESEIFGHIDERVALIVAHVHAVEIA